MCCVVIFHCMEDEKVCGWGVVFFFLKVLCTRWCPWVKAFNWECMNHKQAVSSCVQKQIYSLVHLLSPTAHHSSLQRLVLSKGQQQHINFIFLVAWHVHTVPTEEETCFLSLPWPPLNPRKLHSRQDALKKQGKTLLLATNHPTQ